MPHVQLREAAENYTAHTTLAYYFTCLRDIYLQQLSESTLLRMMISANLISIRDYQITSCSLLPLRSRFAMWRLVCGSGGVSILNGSRAKAGSRSGPRIM